jgi:hypothetical protein
MFGIRDISVRSIGQSVLPDRFVPNVPVQTAALIKTPETCYSEADCVANYHVWWQEGMGNPPTCHANPPESWLQVGGNQQMLLVGTIGIAAVLGVGLWWFTKKE